MSRLTYREGGLSTEGRTKGAREKHKAQSLDNIRPTERTGITRAQFFVYLRTGQILNARDALLEMRVRQEAPRQMVPAETDSRDERRRNKEEFTPIQGWERPGAYDDWLHAPISEGEKRELERKYVNYAADSTLALEQLKAKTYGYGHASNDEELVYEGDDLILGI